MDQMFENPTILEELDFLFKDDTARRMMVYYQPEEINRKVEDTLTIVRSRRLHQPTDASGNLGLDPQI